MQGGNLDVANQTLVERQLKKFGSFLDLHSSRLLHLLDDAAPTDRPNPDRPTDHGDELPLNKVYPVAHHIWDQRLSPIRLTWAPIREPRRYEELICIPLPPEGNPDVQKVLLVLVSLTSQLRQLRQLAVSKFLPRLFLYGESFESDLSLTSASITEGEGHVALSNFLPTLYQLQGFLRTGTEACLHWLSQLAALFKDSLPHVVATATLQLHTVFREFADFLALLVILDEVIGSQSVLQEHWTKYRQMIKSVQADCASFGAEAEKLVQLQKELFHLDKNILCGQIFRNFLSSVTGGSGRSLVKALTLSTKVMEEVIHLSSSLEKDFGEGADELKPIAVASLFMFSATVFPASSDWRKVFNKTVGESLKRIPAVHVGGSVLWLPEQFLNSIPLGNSKLLDSRSSQTFVSNRQNYLQQKVTTLQKDVLSYSMQIGTWGIRLQELFYSKTLDELKLDDLSKRCNLLLQGMKHAQILSQNFRLLMNLHASLGKPVSKQVVCLLCQLLQLLKEVQNLFFRFSVQTSNSAIYIVQHVLHTTLSHIKAVQVILSSPDMKKMEEVRSDALSVFKILENSMRGPPSDKRLLVAQIALDWAFASSRFWKEEDAVMILPAAIDRICNLVTMGSRIEELCNGSSLFFHRIILSTYFSSIYSNEMESPSLKRMFWVLEDCYRFLDHSPHREQAKKYFLAEVGVYFQSNLTTKLCQDVETDLRLLAHSHLQVQPSESTSPFRVGIKELLYFLDTPTLSFDHRHSTNFRLTTEYYLSKTFYNLASVALHDWQSYATMRVLAGDKYELDVVDDHLPGHSLEQGRDVLEIVRNLSKFVQEFTYNLNHQVFIQVTSQNKHLDTVNIRHLANSMRTHGPGMANTTVNATYQFLRPKMHTLSQFLYEEQIRSRLAKDIRLFKQIRLESSAANPTNPSNFPFNLAEKFKKGIRKLGVQDGLTWLDHFRILLTHIGNALGFVRLVRSGGLHFLAGGCRFVPDFEDLLEFREMYRTSKIDKDGEDLWTTALQDATAGVDCALKNLTSSFSGGVDYFKLLVTAFRSACQDDRNSHFRNFYVIIPALTLAYVDHMRLCKEKLAKKSKSASVFTDDGFPMGLAYLLQVLGQDNDFDSLGWFTSVKVHFAEEKRREMQLITEARNDEKLEQASKLTAKRFQDQLQEFELLRYNLSSARIFFQHKDQSSQTSK